MPFGQDHRGSRVTRRGASMIAANRLHPGQLGPGRQTPFPGRCPCKGLTWYPGLRTIRKS